MFEFNKKGGADQAPDLTPRDAQPAASATPEPRPAATTAPRASTPPATTRREPATIGPSIHIDGQLRGEEDLFVEGQVSGAVHLESHSLTIGSQGKVMADVFAHTIYVDGSVEGDLYGAEQVTIRRNARVRGNIVSPRVSLEDGATFKGSIEMDPEAVKAAIKPANSARGAVPGRPQASETQVAGGTVKSGPAGNVSVAGGSPR